MLQQVQKPSILLFIGIISWSLLSGCGPMMMANKMSKSDTAMMKCGGMMQGMKCSGDKTSTTKSKKNKDTAKCNNGTDSTK